LFPSRTAGKRETVRVFRSRGRRAVAAQHGQASDIEEAEMSEHESDVDPDEIDRRAAERAPVEEAGGGESEGFELAEEELVENAVGVGEGDPLEDSFTPE
jgi:hypothetical protein